MRIRTISTIVLASSAALLLAGCTADATETTSPKPSSSKKAAPTDQYTPAAYENACDGTQAVLDNEGGEHELEDGCKFVSVVGSGSKYTIGATETLAVEGSNLDITVSKADRVMLLGANNKVHVTAGTPTVDDQGTGNTVD